MSCYYYVLSELVIEFCDDHDVIHKTRSYISMKQKYISIPDEDSGEDLETQQNRYNREVDKYVKTNTYDKMLYVNNSWVKETYKKRYFKQISNICPTMYRIHAVYKSHLAWKPV